MYYLVMYDISSDKTRRLAVKLCKKAGLVRVQKSVFGGASTPLLINNMVTDLSPLLNTKTDSLTIQPLDKPSYERLAFVGQSWNKKILAREQTVVFV